LWVCRTSTPLNLYVVDQAHLVVIERGCQEGVAGEIGEELEGLAIDELEVIDFQILRSVLKEEVAGGLEVNLDPLFAVDSQVAGGEESASKAGCVGALERGEIEIAGGEGEAIGFADGLQAMDLDGQGQVSDQAPDDRELLVVFLSEEGIGGGQDIEEFEHDGADALKVTGSGRATEVLGKETFAHRDRVVGGEKVGGLGEKCGVYAKLLTNGEVGFHDSGIGLQVGGTVELEGIDENGDQHRARLARDLARTTNEGAVTLVKRTHGGDEDHGSGKAGGDLGDGAKAEHGAIFLRYSDYLMTLSFHLPRSSFQ